ncbi:MAG: hypothetical protein CSA23_03415 [Deltaproteobacteria bacterium]|nr:MAG: hypothetical protein CSA23_03415 [Deltaproteobacteria bacterium]
MKRKKKKTRKTETCFSRNVRLLKKRFPDAWRLMSAYKNPETLNNATGNPTGADRRKQSMALFYGNRTPAGAVKKMVADWHYQAHDLLFLIGMGLGYLPLELVANQNFGKPRIIILEPSIQFFHDALTMVDLKPLITDDRVELFVGEGISIPTIVARFKERICIGKSPIMIHPAYETIFGEALQSLKSRLSDHIREAKGTWHTVKTFGKRMFTNNIENLPSLFAGTPMRQLKGKFKGLPAICVAAGPSLDDALDHLKKIGDRALIIACDSAINSLYQARVKPHIVVTIDHQKINIHKLKPYMDFLRDSALIFGLEANPDNVRLFLGKRRIGVTAFSKLMSFWLDPQLALDGLFPDMTSVSHMALFSALAMAADPIVLVGMDLAFSQGKSHSSRSPFFQSLDSRALISVSGNKGGSLHSVQHFVNDRLLIENIAEKQVHRLINTCIDGAYIEGTQIKSLTEVMAVNIPDDLNIKPVLEAIDWSCAADESQARSELRVFVRLLEKVRTQCQKGRDRLLAEMEGLSHRKPSNEDFKRCADAEKRFKEFEKENLVYKSMVLEIMLEDWADIARKRETLFAEDAKKQIHRVKDRLDLICREYDILASGLDFKIREIDNVIRLLTDLADMKSASALRQGDGRLNSQRADLFRQNREIWQAAREYRSWMAMNPDDIRPYVGLVQSFLDTDLLTSAQSVLMEAKRAFGGAPEVIKMESDISQAVDAVFEKMKSEWMQGNIDTTRKALYAYLMLRPEDAQANELKKVMHQVDEAFSEEWVQKDDQTQLAEESTRLHQMVGLVKQKQLEKGIGVLEGMYQDFPRNRAAIRQQIGDIRMMQKDFSSALWNYTRVLELAPMKVEIKNRIDKVRQLLSDCSSQK